MLQGLFALFAGYLVERERKAKELSEGEKGLARIWQVAIAIVYDLTNPIITILGFLNCIKKRAKNADAAMDIVNRFCSN